MKRKLVMILAASMMLVGCGDLTKEATEEATVQASEVEDDADTEDSKEDESAEAATEASSEDSDEDSEANAMDLLKGFLGENEDLVEAVCDVDISVDSYYGQHLFDFDEGDELTIEDLKAGLENGEWADESKLSYTFFYEDTESPVLVVRVPDNPNYPDENNCILFFTVEDGEVHLASCKDTMMDETTHNYVGINGLISYKAQPLGRSCGNVLVNNTYVVDEEGQLVQILSETMCVESEAEYMGETYRAFGLFAEMYGEENWSYISMVECGSETYYVLYSDESDIALDAAFIDACDKEGIKIYTRDELLPLINGYIEELGFDADIADLDNNAAEWDELD